jgi:hypothetical protein
MLDGCFKDPERMIRTAYEYGLLLFGLLDANQSLHRHLKPNGILECQGVVPSICCGDETVDKSDNISKWTELRIDAAMRMQRPLDCATNYKAWMEKAGFKDIKETIFIWPINPWPKHYRLKCIGKWTFENFNLGLDGLTLAPFTRGLGWSAAETLAFCSLVRKDLRNTTKHGYFEYRVVHGRKQSLKEAERTA